MKNNFLGKFLRRNKTKATKFKERVAFTLNMLMLTAITTPTYASASEVYTTAIDSLKIIVMAIGVAYGGWGLINLFEGYGNDNPGAKSQGIKQLMAGIGVALIGYTVIPKLNGMISLG